MERANLSRAEPGPASPNIPGSLDNLLKEGGGREYSGCRPPRLAGWQGWEHHCQTACGCPSELSRRLMSGCKPITKILLIALIFLVSVFNISFQLLMRMETLNATIWISRLIKPCLIPFRNPPPDFLENVSTGGTYSVVFSYYELKKC